jgi:hypothetical protein
MGVSRVRDAASKGLRFEKSQFEALETVREQPAAAALHDGIDEQPIFVDKTGLDPNLSVSAGTNVIAFINNSFDQMDMDQITG